MAEPWGILIGMSIVAGAWLGPAAVLPVVWFLLVFQLLSGRFRWLPLALVGVLCLVGAARMAVTSDPVLPPSAADSWGATGTIASMTRDSATGGSVLVRVHEVRAGGDTNDVPPFLVWMTLSDNQNVSRGDQVTVRWSLTPLAEVSPGYASWVEAQGAVATARAWSLTVDRPGPWFFREIENLRDRISHGLMDVLPGDRGALAAGIVTGDDSALSPDTQEVFRLTGTSHITAVSGTNVAMVVALWAAIVPASTSRRLLLVQAAIVISVWLYALLTGLEPPATRAATMASLILLGSRFGRRPDPMTLLALTSAAMVLWNPRNVELAAFWLSVVATAAIITRLPDDPDVGWSGRLWGMGQGVLLAQLATLPIVVSTFGTWSLVSVLANLVLAPLMALAFPLSFVLGGIVLIAPWLAGLIAWIPGGLLGLSLLVVTDLSTVLPVVTADHLGLAGVLLLVVPCAVLVVAMGREVRRWLPLAEDRWRLQPLLVTLVAIGPLIGLLLALAASSASR